MHPLLFNVWSIVMKLVLDKVVDASMQALHDEEEQMFESLFQTLEATEVDVAKVAACLAEIKQHTQAHFSHEEKMMQEVNFPPYPAHAAEHKNAYAKLVSLIEQWSASHNHDALRSGLTNDYLVWLKRHVSTMDDLTAQFYRQKKGYLALP